MRPTKAMNIYICSTVRHLLFSILRGAHTPQEAHHIVYFSDYQSAPLSDWTLTEVPDNIFIYEFSRKDFVTNLKTTISGRLYYWLANKYMPVPNALRESFLHQLNLSGLPFADDWSSETTTLWLFNERNKMARLYRPLVSEFLQIEDGDANYHIFPVPWWKSPGRLLRGLPLRHKAFGDSKHCKEIWAIYPERLPVLTRKKGRPIDFLNTDITKHLVPTLFDSKYMQQNEKRPAILATQPLEGIPGVNRADKIRIYDQIARYLVNKGWQVTLKLHPKENPDDYEQLSTQYTSAPAKIPLEAFILSSNHRLLVVSVCSTAGLGLEKLCKRVRVCQSDYGDTVRLWKENPAELDASMTNELDILNNTDKSH